MSKGATKKNKDGSKSSVSQFLRLAEDEIKAEIEAMTNLEYNLHTDYDAEVATETPLFSVRKTRGVNSTDSTKNLPAAMEKSAKSEKCETENQIQIYVPNASQEELHFIIRQAGATPEDKYKILDARDRLMRMKQSKSEHLSMTKITRGTCPDMCPEKERLMRESQRQVAPYELTDGGEYRINHETAVKQYSRSSADQEEPMPHDLRPVKTLKMTMSYLLHEIADLCEQNSTNLAEWYHFLWDRTRGIRKDITQQELCCFDSVELVEQCARFHIVCAEYLCAEEVSVFDKKINTENLTKCLQTLKYMYYDLRIKGIECKNEPEFRAYIILLNLNNGNFMWDVQKLPIAVQRSPEVRFAIDVYSSIESNNYAKFFKLVRKTTYLNACILLRYFNQVRIKALQIMVKAYCRTTSTPFPLYELIDILGFEDEKDAIYFCEQAGLGPSNDDLDIMLNRQNFTKPESNMEQTRAFNTVEAKRLATNSLIGECIAGEKMPEKLYKNHVPHSSFDAHGYLKSESLNAYDQNPNKDHKLIDPFDFIDEEMSEIQQPLKRERKKQTLTSGTFGLASSSETKKPEVPHVFKMPSAATPSNIFQGTPKFAKQNAALKAKKDNSPFTESTWPAMKKTQDFDSTPSVATTAVSSIFGNASNVTNIFAKTLTDTAKPFGEQLGARGTNFSTSIPPGSSIFGQVPQANVFGNTAIVPSKFASPNNQNTSKTKAELWSAGKSSIFQNSQQAPVSKIQSPKRSDNVRTARECQESERIQELEKRRLLEMEQVKIMRRIDRETETIFDELQSEVINDICSNIVKEEIQKLKLYNDLGVKIVNEIIDEFTRENCAKILNDEIRIQQRIEELARRIKNRLILKYFKIWRQFTLKNRQQRIALDATPVWLQRASVDECAKSLYRKGQDLAIMNMRRKRLKTSVEEPQLEYLEPIETKIYMGIKENARTLDTEMPPNLFWKMLISWPHLETRPMLWRHKKIINQYLCPSDCTMEPIIKSYKPNSYETLHICIKQFEGLIKDYHVTGMDGFVFIATVTEDLKFIVRRLTNTVLSRQKLMPIPVFVVILGEENMAPEKINLDNELNKLVESGYISEYVVRYEKTVNETSILNMIQNASLWLTINKSPPIPLEMDYLGSIIESCLTEELWLRIMGHSSFNENLESALNDVNFVIDLHNEAVNHLTDILLDPETLLYTDFPPEFKMFLAKDSTLPCSYEYFDASWKSEENREKLEFIMHEILLPKWTVDWPIDDTMELHRSVVRYCQKTLSEFDCNVVSNKILSNVLLMPGRASKTSFVPVLLEILRKKIVALKLEARVVYNKNHVKHFRTLPWWFKSLTLTNYNENSTQSRAASTVAAEETLLIDETSILAEIGDAIDEVVKSYDNFHEEAENPASSRCEESQTKVAELRNIAERLEKTLEEQKLRSRRLDEKLQAALRESDSIF